MTAKSVDLLAEYIAKKLARLQPSEEGGLSMSQRSWLAHLRNSVAKPIGSDPATWEITLADLPPQLVGRGDAPSYAEETCHRALCLYAVHQQSKSMTMHKPQIGVGRAVAQLINKSEGQTVAEGSIRKRFDTLVSANTVPELLVHLRHLITMLRAQEIPLDYVRLAKDIYIFNFVGSRDSVRLRWARELYQTKPEVDHSKNDQKD